MSSSKDQLNKDQMGIVKKHAGHVLEDLLKLPTPLWSDVGYDQRQELCNKLLDRLKEKHNRGIAEIIEADPDIANKILADKVRSMRYGQRLKHQSQHQPQNASLDEQDSASASHNDGFWGFRPQ
ncbi:hypothetical protein VM1G_11909 [Cytospora mali]|uniref:Uncharacterized protein n=1 Tax=Cytospora mali TaxID=578113 RepID=A0A194WAI9_CYTMA|nr:hypothetical protein VM1G_11909 [Valsa mali]